MLRLFASLLIGALLIAPLGFSESSSTVLAMIARLVFGALVLTFVLFSGLSVFWSRRWAV